MKETGRESLKCKRLGENKNETPYRSWNRIGRQNTPYPLWTDTCDIFVHCWSWGWFQRCAVSSSISVRKPYGLALLIFICLTNKLFIIYHLFFWFSISSLTFSQYHPFLPQWENTGAQFLLLTPGVNWWKLKLLISKKSSTFTSVCKGRFQ